MEVCYEPVRFETANNVEEMSVFDGLPVMTKAELASVALEHGGYSTPSLNDTLYLHFKGYQRIENLVEYTGLKSIWLHSNGFGKIENLGHLTELRCLFLQSNCIARIENLEGLTSLVQLDLSENNIRFIEGLAHLPKLTTLNLSKNALKDAESISHLKECCSLSSIDLSKNDLAGEDVIDCLAGITKLASLNMAGNPVVSKVAFFRKKLLAASKTLRYLDRPVFDNERAAIEAWAVGGPEAEAKVKEEWKQMIKDKHRHGTQEFRDWQATVRSDGVPHYEVAGSDGFEEALSHEEDVDGVVAFCQELKDKYLEAGADNVPLMNAEEKTQDTAALTDRPFIEVISESSPPPKATKVTFEEGTKQEPHCFIFEEPQDDCKVAVETDVFKGKRIRDSIAIMKRSQSTSAKQMSKETLGWTGAMDDALIQKVEEFGYDFEAVAVEMAKDFGDTVIDFNDEVCDRRFSLIDTSIQEEFLKELRVSNDASFPSSDKPLASFVNADGTRKSIDQLRRDSGSSAITPTTLPSCGTGNDESNINTRAYGRRELWDMLESKLTEADVDDNNNPVDNDLSE
jgi:dynein assembly factor 1